MPTVVHFYKTLTISSNHRQKYLRLHIFTVKMIYCNFTVNWFSRHRVWTIFCQKAFFAFLPHSFQESPSRFENSCFQQRKGAFTPNRVSPRSKKRRLFDSWCRHGAKIKKAPFRRLFSIFRKIVFFSKIKGAFTLIARPHYIKVQKAPFFQKVWTFSFHWKKKLSPYLF